MTDHEEKIPAEDIIADVMVALNDEGYTRGLTPGFYLERVKQVVHNLHIKLYLRREYQDFDIPDNLVIPVPDDFFNTNEAYLHYGECCTPIGSTRLLWKRQLRNSPGGKNFTATQNVNGQADPYSWQNMYGWLDSQIPGFFYGNIDSGNIMLSSNVRGCFTKLRLIYNSMGGNAYTVPMVPRIIHELVTALTIFETVPYLIVKYPKEYKDLYTIYDRKLNTPYEGLMDKYRTILNAMSSWEQQNFNERTVQGNR